MSVWTSKKAINESIFEPQNDIQDSTIFPQWKFAIKTLDSGFTEASKFTRPDVFNNRIIVIAVDKSINDQTK